MDFWSGAGSAILGGLFGAKGQKDANEASIELANTAYQRAMSDMRKAGLNPILAGKLGGATVPNIGNVGAAGSQAALSGAQTATAKEQAVQAKVGSDFAQKTGLTLSTAPDLVKYGYAVARAGGKMLDAMPPASDMHVHSGKKLSELYSEEKTPKGRLKVIGNEIAKDFGVPAGARNYIFGVKR